MEVSSVTFGAKPINDVVIKKLDKSTKEFIDYPAKFVKIDPDNKVDLSVLNLLVQKWKGATYIRRIATNSHWMKSRKYVEIDVYALTTQNNNFERLKPNKILGLAEMRNDADNPKNRKLWHLQVKPSAINVNNKNKQYKYVGSSMLDSLKKIYKNMSLCSDDNKNIKEFYKKNNFVEYYEGRNHFSWSSNLFTMLKIRIKALKNKWKYYPFV